MEHPPCRCIACRPRLKRGAFCGKGPRELREAIGECFKLSKKVMVEEFIEGRDFTVGILKNQDVV